MKSEGRNLARSISRIFLAPTWSYSWLKLSTSLNWVLDMEVWNPNWKLWALQSTAIDNKEIGKFDPFDSGFTELHETWGTWPRAWRSLRGHGHELEEASVPMAASSKSLSPGRFRPRLVKLLYFSWPFESAFGYRKKLANLFDILSS